MANVVSAVAAAEQEFRACAALREGGTSPQAQAAAAQAAKLYGAALKALHRFGATSRRFWESIEAVSLALDTILHTYPGDADYYFNAAQFEELVLPALLAVGTGVGVNPRGGPQLIAQMAVVGDFVHHSHCEALPRELLDAAAGELCRVLGLLLGSDPEVLYCTLSALGTLMYNETRRDRSGGEDYTRHVPLAVAADLARRGALKPALLMLERTADVHADMFGGVGDGSAFSHILMMAQSMVAGLLVTGDVAAAQRWGRWVARRPAAVAMLLDGVVDPRGEQATIDVLSCLRLAGRLASVCPELLEKLDAGGFRARVERLRRAMTSPVDSDEVAAWLQRLYQPQPGQSGADFLPDYAPGPRPEARQARQAEIGRAHV